MRRGGSGSGRPLGGGEDDSWSEESDRVEGEGVAHAALSPSSSTALSPRSLMLLERKAQFEQEVSLHDPRDCGAASATSSDDDDDDVGPCHLDAEELFHSTRSRSLPSSAGEGGDERAFLVKGGGDHGSLASQEECTSDTSKRACPSGSTAGDNEAPGEGPGAGLSAGGGSDGGLDDEARRASAHCRICFEGEDEKGELLRSNLCDCSGTMAFLHKSCLDKWITESKTLECEICKQPFNLPDSEVEEWQALFEQTTASRHALSIGVQAEQEEVPAFEGIENRRLRSCLQRTWRNRGAMNSSIIVLIGTSVLVMMSLVLYHFLSPSGERVIAGALPPGQSLYEPFNCTMHQGGSGEEQRNMDAVGWLCGVPATQIYQGDCVGRDDDEPCGEWNKFTLLQSSIPRCFFGHGSICYVALQPDPKLGGICREGACIPFESSKQGRKKMENGMLAQGRCVACQ